MITNKEANNQREREELNKPVIKYLPFPQSLDLKGTFKILYWLILFYVILFYIILFCIFALDPRYWGLIESLTSFHDILLSSLISCFVLVSFLNVSQVVFNNYCHLYSHVRLHSEYV